MHYKCPICVRMPQFCLRLPILKNVLSTSTKRQFASSVEWSDISLIIPCHRVVGSDGGLTGYAGGIALKEKLLILEKKYTRYGVLLDSAISCICFGLWNILLDAELADQLIQRLCLLGQFVGDCSAFFGSVRVFLNDLGNFFDPVFHGNDHF